MLDRLEAARHEAAARVLQAQEEERRRLALELHDQTGQSLTALTLHAEVLAQGLADEQAGAREQARQQALRLGALAQRTLSEVQALSRQLRPPMLDDLGLAAALHWLADDAGQRLGVTVRVRMRLPEEERLPSDVETALFRIAQEAVTNAVRHGHARTVRIALRRLEEVVALTVADDGGGFTTRSTPAPGGLGVDGMRERARLLRGTLTLRSRSGQGCTVRARLPLHREVVAAAPASGGLVYATPQR
jgi:two-component system sensor histidine kinase UhpB